VIPAQIVLPVDIEERAVLETYLIGRREAPVKIVCPRRGELRRLAELAVKNAKLSYEGSGVVGRNKELLEELQDMLELKSYPRRIECFDVSNFQGKEAVASQATFIEGESAKALYRHYRVRTIDGADDYGMLAEVLERRIARGIREGDLPDLLVVDGGRGQLNVALKVLDRLGVEDMDVLGIAKVKEGGRKQRRVRGKERIYMPHLPDPLLLEGISESLYLLERIRDEAHRFAIGHHKQLRSKRLEASVLDDVPGVGPVLKRRLLAAFGSVDALRNASVAELVSIQGVSQGLACRLRDFLALRS
jgi:excinuclease ABC subunit C